MPTTSTDPQAARLAMLTALLREQQAYHFTSAMIARIAKNKIKADNHLAMHDKIKAALKGES